MNMLEDEGLMESHEDPRTKEPILQLTEEGFKEAAKDNPISPLLPIITDLMKPTVDNEKLAEECEGIIPPEKIDEELKKLEREKERTK